MRLFIGIELRISRNFPSESKTRRTISIIDCHKQHAPLPPTLTSIAFSPSISLGESERQSAFRLIREGAGGHSKHKANLSSGDSPLDTESQLSSSADRPFYSVYINSLGLLEIDNQHFPLKDALFSPLWMIMALLLLLCA